MTTIENLDKYLIYSQSKIKSILSARFNTNVSVKNDIFFLQGKHADEIKQFLINNNLVPIDNILVH